MSVIVEILRLHWCNPEVMQSKTKRKERNNVNTKPSFNQQIKNTDALD